MPLIKPLREILNEKYSHILTDILENFKFVEKAYVVDEQKEKIFFGVRFNTNGEKDEALLQLEARLREKIHSKDIVVFDSAEKEVEHVMSRVREYIRSHGGDIEVKEISEGEGLVVVSLKGACALCPSAVATMKAGVKRILSDHIPWIKKVEPAEKPVEPNFGFKLAPKPTQKVQNSKI
jgi:Fe-S cluster biogenesis protein NfuA